jgi:hypothetical protein
MVALTQSVWDLTLDHPIEVGRVRLATLGDVGKYILALPETTQRHELWDAAAETVIEATKSGDTKRVSMVVHMALIMSGQDARSVRA